MILENLLEKYKKLTNDEHIIWMLLKINSMSENISSVDLLFKINRWLGFVQGFLYSQKMRTVDELKEETRGIDNEFIELLKYFYKEESIITNDVEDYEGRLIALEWLGD